MLTNTPKVGDRVLIRYTKEHFRILPVDKVGAKYLWVDGYKFGFNGRGGNGNTGYELFDSEETYSRHFQRDRNISKIKKAVSVYSFGDGLSDEDLEQICKLIEVKSWA